MESGDMIVNLVVVALLVEAVVSTLKPLWDVGDRENLGDRIAGLVVGELAAFGGGFDIFQYAGVPLANLELVGPWLGWGLTGIILSRGSNFVHDLIKGMYSLSKGLKDFINGVMAKGSTQ